MQGKSLLETPVQYVPSVGPARAKLLSRLDIHSVEELLYTPPRRYEDRSHFTPINQLVDGALQTVMGTILQVEGRRARRGLPIVEAMIADDSGTLRATWFHQPYLAKRLVTGERVILYGKVERAPSPRMTSPDYELVRSDETDSLHMGRIVPIYSTTAALSQRQLRQMVHAAIERFSYRIIDPLPQELRVKHELLDLPTALRTIQFPPDWASLERARQRLVFDECFTVQLVLALRRQLIQAARKPQRYQLTGSLTEQFAARLPFTLTAGQRAVLQDIVRDLEQPQPMNRLVQGEVGSGKTVLAMHAMLVAVQSGYQAALMVPTEILAEQHARTLRAAVEPLGVPVQLLSRGVEVSQRRQVEREIATGAPMIVIGTHALIQRTVRFERLALVVIDEQHKFGVAQRAHLRAQGRLPDVLVMTATPIPRTLAMTVYGDLDMSTLRELPPGRQTPETRWMRGNMREALYALLRAELRAGHQGYVVYPLIEETADSDLRAATQMAKHLQEVFADCRVGLLHGKMPSDKKTKVMTQFARGALQLLVSTIVIEVGIDVANATVMVIEHAERFGLAQLHQLRGRIGRGSAPSCCVVVSDAGAPEAMARLQALVQLSDGFQLAERDLALRGPGDILSTRQHGLPELRFANLLTDQPVLQAARQEARDIVAGSTDPRQRRELTELIERLLAKYRQIDLA